MATALTSLIPRLLQGDETAQSELVDRSLGPLTRIARRHGVQADDVEEVVFKALDSTLRSLKQFKPDQQSKDPLLNYLARTVKNEAFERHRNKEIELRALGNSANIDPDQNVPIESVDDDKGGSLLWSSSPEESSIKRSDPMIMAVRKQLDQLSELDRNIVRLKMETDLTWNDIGEEVGLSSEAARQRMSRILAGFKRSPELSRYL
jgi:RNA polymerase sigma factor (sigma-70 family)